MMCAIEVTPTLSTERLLLRGVVNADAERIAELANDQGVASMTTNMPHPYTPADAESWLSHCRSLDWQAVESSGRGTVYSYVMPHEPKFPFFEYPYIVVLVELEEGVRLVSNLTGIDPAEVTPGLPVEVYYQTFDGSQELVLHQFRPSA